MKQFDEWIRSGPLSDEPITDRERTLLNIAYLEGVCAAIEEAQQKAQAPEARAA